MSKYFIGIQFTAVVLSDQTCFLVRKMDISEAEEQFWLIVQKDNAEVSFPVKNALT